MFEITVLISISSVIFSHALIQNLEMKMEVVKELIVTYNHPLIPVGYFCDYHSKLAFSKAISTELMLHKVANIDSDDLEPTYSANNVLFIVDGNCESIEKFLLKANALNLLMSPYRWLVIFHDISLNEKIGIFKNINILVDSDFQILVLHSEGHGEVYSIYKHTPSSDLITNSIKTWDINYGYKDLQRNVPISKQRQNLMGTLLKSCMVITNNDSLLHLTDKRDKHIDSISKVNYVFMFYLKDMLNATMTFTFENTWAGSKANSNEYSGMVGELVRKETDIGGTPLFFLSDRVSTLDYIAMTCPTKSKFVFRQPKLSLITNVFTLPFDGLVWASSLGLIVVTAITLYAVIKIQMNNQNIEEVNIKFVDVALLAFGAVCQQGSFIVPASMSGRILMIILFISVMFLYTSYSANIVALLQSSSTSIQTLEDLLHSRLQVGVDDTVYNRYFFPITTEPVRRALYNQKVAPPGKSPNYMSLYNGISLMRKGLFAFHMEAGPGYKIIGETFFEEEKCGLKEIEFLQVPDPWLAVQKNLSYKEMLKIGLRKIHESGLQNREVSIYYPNKPECAARSSSFEGVTIVDCYPAIMVFVIGVGISLAIFLFELIFKHGNTLVTAISFKIKKPFPFTS